MNQLKRIEIIISLAKKVLENPIGTAGYKPEDAANLAFHIQEYEWKQKTAISHDVSWMWHCSCLENKIMDFSNIIKDSSKAIAMSRASALGFRLCLRRLEDLDMITMGDIDRIPNEIDEDKWEILLNPENKGEIQLKETN